MKKVMKRVASYKGRKYDWMGCPAKVDNYEDQIIEFCDGNKSLWALTFNDKHDIINAVLSGITHKFRHPDNKRVRLELKARHSKAKGRHAIAMPEMWIHATQIIRQYLTGTRVYYRHHPSSCWRIADGPLVLSEGGAYSTDVLDLYKDYGPTFTEITHVSLEEVVRKPVLESYKANLDPKHREQIQKDLEAVLAKKMQAKAEEDAVKAILDQPIADLGDVKPGLHTVKMPSVEEMHKAFTKVSDAFKNGPIVEMKHNAAYVQSVENGLPKYPGLFMQQCGRAYRERLGGLEQQAEKVIRKAIMEVVYHEDRIGPSHRAHGMASRIIRKIKEQVGEAPKPSEPVVNPEPKGIMGFKANVTAVTGVGPIGRLQELSYPTAIMLEMKAGNQQYFDQLRELLRKGELYIDVSELTKTTAQEADK